MLGMLSTFKYHQAAASTPTVYPHTNTHIEYMITVKEVSDQLSKNVGLLIFLLTFSTGNQDVL